jgi:hypothetical protein
VYVSVCVHDIGIHTVGVDITHGNDLPEQKTNIAGSVTLHDGMSVVFPKCCVSEC